MGKLKREERREKGEGRREKRQGRREKGDERTVGDVGVV